MNRSSKKNRTVFGQNREQWKKVLSTPTDKPLFLIIICLLVVGLVMLYSVSYANAIYYQKDGLYYIKRQAVFAFFGVAFMILVSLFPYQYLHKLAGLMYLVCYLMLWATQLFPAVNDAHRWFILGPISFQPSELMKFCLILILAHLISLDPDRIRTRGGFISYTALVLFTIVPVFFQPHVSGSIIIAALGFMVLFIGGARLAHFGAGLGIAAAVMVPVILLVPRLNYALQRILTNVNGGDISDDAYQTYQSMIAIGSGGLFGVGLGNSRQKQMYVPFAENDFVFSIVCEELGFFGAVAIILLFVFLLARGAYIANHCRDRFGAILASGVCAHIALQVCLNIGVVSGFFPNTGIAFPFFSQGGSSLFVLLCELGVVLSVARYSNLENGAKKQ